ncbi:hypothetical protein XBP1_1340085 [Xenorhabdus bovienii str. puntauvense]|uniref:Uncharacterized protein n=3 Tax=Xenorhabdus bovienii TaxID=40576 RepID=A0A077QJ27_XENBV|nr:hypothetical protein XBFFR1_1760035 [Xenorhabdus bovienii str. feltiae France]CDG90865.1 hypothetical protein XBFFL1_1160002 [Xenorhabdus bovienii str. feltiae Florida]CDG95540.1 hypothetical protein XBP1_1340085 [Xenorhabdus bovienii str. puntauvense]CDH22481.1 hypothetical protein XBKB1_1170024 [Xenorhabdus bovienii str. kraussei Becker Underwood]CDH32386.1 hypothetical protein XBI1_1940017 [Xenorhabdus bovienii str. Intermedium]
MRILTSWLRFLRRPSIIPGETSFITHLRFCPASKMAFFTVGSEFFVMIVVCGVNIGAVRAQPASMATQAKLINSLDVIFMDFLWLDKCIKLVNVCVSRSLY